MASPSTTEPPLGRAQTLRGLGEDRPPAGPGRQEARARVPAARASSRRRRRTGKNGTMHVSAKVDYAMRALLVIAQERAAPGALIKGDHLAVRAGHPGAVPRGDPPPAAAGRASSPASAVLKAATGSLARRPTITVADVVRALDGPLADVRGDRPENADYNGAAEHLSDVWIATRAALRGVLDHVTLADIASGRPARNGHRPDQRPRSLVLTPSLVRCHPAPGSCNSGCTHPSTGLGSCHTVHRATPPFGPRPTQRPRIDDGSPSCAACHRRASTSTPSTTSPDPRVASSPTRSWSPWGCRRPPSAGGHAQADTGSDSCPATYLVHRGTPTFDERLNAALQYAGPQAELTGLGALHLYGLRNLPATPPELGLHVLLPHQRHAKSAAFLTVERTQSAARGGDPGRLSGRAPRASPVRRRTPPRQPSR